VMADCLVVEKVDYLGESWVVLSAYLQDLRSVCQSVGRLAVAKVAPMVSLMADRLAVMLVELMVAWKAALMVYLWVGLRVEMMVLWLVVWRVEQWVGLKGVLLVEW
jgi:hypothetical protein